MTDPPTPPPSVQPSRPPGVASGAMNERPEDDPGADTAMFRAYVEHDDGESARTSLVYRPGILVGVAAVLVLVVLALILLFM